MTNCVKQEGTAGVNLANKYFTLQEVRLGLRLGKLLNKARYFQFRVT